MNTHADDDQSGHEQLIVRATSTCRSRSVLSPSGWPRLVIDYGDAALAFDVGALREAETFALALARNALAFASHCRYLDDQHSTKRQDSDYR